MWANIVNLSKKCKCKVIKMNIQKPQKVLTKDMRIVENILD